MSTKQQLLSPLTSLNVTVLTVQPSVTHCLISNNKLLILCFCVFSEFLVCFRTPRRFFCTVRTIKTWMGLRSWLRRCRRCSRADQVGNTRFSRFSLFQSSWTSELCSLCNMFAVVQQLIRVCFQDTCTQIHIFKSNGSSTTTRSYRFPHEHSSLPYDPWGLYRNILISLQISIFDL